jgi:hypothetical protein
VGDIGPDASGAYRNVSVLELLVAMACTSESVGCSDAENNDGDHFFCLPKSSQLDGIFQSAAIALDASPRLITLPG